MGEETWVPERQGDGSFSTETTSRREIEFLARATAKEFKPEAVTFLIEKVTKKSGAVRQPDIGIQF